MTATPSIKRRRARRPAIIHRELSELIEIRAQLADLSVSLAEYKAATCHEARVGASHAFWARAEHIDTRLRALATGPSAFRTHVDAERWRFDGLCKEMITYWFDRRQERTAKVVDLGSYRRKRQLLAVSSTLADLPLLTRSDLDNAIA